VLGDPKEAELKNLYFGQSKFLTIKLPNGKTSQPLLVSRGGYTGEDGFEISINPDEVCTVSEALFEAAGPEQLRWAGLGARDSLRLETGMCLYGHDLEDTITPVETALGWVVACRDDE
jgi:aminomethyltransferase